MQKIVVGICDDEASQRENIQKMCEDYFVEQDIRYKCICFESGESVLAYQGEIIQLLFLDILMSGMDGIQVLRSVESMDHVRQIVFVSSHEDAVWDAFGRKKLGFERKPVARERVEKWIKTAMLETQDNLVIECSTISGNQWVELDKIYYIKAQKNYVNFCTSDNSFLVTGNLKSWEEKLKVGCMIRVHKTFLVNPICISSIGKEVLLKNGSKIPVGRQFRTQLKDEYDAYMRKKIRERV